MQKVLSNTRKLSTYFFIIISVLGCGESEPNPEPPEELIPPSEIGAGFVSCLIDGEVWNVRDNNRRESVGGSLTAGGLILVSGRNTPFTEESLIIEANNISEPGIFPIRTGLAIANYNMNVIFEDGTNSAVRYLTNQNHEGSLVITFLDTENNIISGTFSFDAQDPVSGKVIQVRDGRFDFIY